jgi:uncharacterized RDD family membrane protein YckC
VIVADLVTGEAVVVDVPYARFGSRMIAITLDLIVEVVVLAISLVLLTRSASTLDPAALGAIGLTLTVLVVVGYPTIFETVTRGRSLGKLALGLRVVSENGGPERFRQAFLRALTGVIEIWMFLGSPALICSLLSAKGKRLGDVFAGTVVIQERLPAHGGPIAVMPPPLAGWAAGLELSGLQDETAAMARQYLARFYELTPAARDELGNRIASAVAATVSPPPPPGTPAAAYLSAVLAERRNRAQARPPSAGWPAPGAGWPAPSAGWPAPAAGWPAPAAPSHRAAPGPAPAAPGPAPAVPTVPAAPFGQAVPAGEPETPGSERGQAGHAGFAPPE